MNEHKLKSRIKFEREIEWMSVADQVELMHLHSFRYTE